MNILPAGLLITILYLTILIASVFFFRWMRLQLFKQTKSMLISVLLVVFLNVLFIMTLTDVIIWTLIKVVK